VLDRPWNDLSDLRDPEAAAQAVSLAYTSDEERGFRRIRTGRGFRYLDDRGAKLVDPAIVERIRALAIPPAWTDVWISPEPDGHLQATGRDQRGRKQYRYHERWAQCRDAVKFSSLAHFADALPALRSRVDADLRKRSLSRERVVAMVVWLLDNTMIRVGNAAYAQENSSFGLTTLKSRHVRIDGANMRFAFTGKSGKEWKLKISDRRIARAMKGIQELPGQQLFQYLDDGDDRRTVRSDDVNTYIRTATGSPFTSKHFRTWGGTVEAAMLLAEEPAPDSGASGKRVVNAVVDKVAAKLGNTRAVCRSCYIHPGVIEDWHAGSLGEAMRAARRSFRKLPKWLDVDEMTVRRWLERR
jgi:DNA topoisomerase-1